MTHILNARRSIWSTAELLREMSSTELARRTRLGSLVRVTHGWYIDAGSWEEAGPDARHHWLTAAVTGGLRDGDGVISHVTAALAWDLPVVRASLHRVYLTDQRSRAGASVAIARHQQTLSEADRTQVEDLAITSLDRTVIDVARSESRECGIAVADAALRRIAWHEPSRAYDEEIAEDWRNTLCDQLSRMARHPGTRKANEVIRSADGRAESPGESISRLYLFDIGFTQIRTQVPVVAAGRRFEVDFAIDDAGVWGEFDGRGKYLDPALTGGRAMREILDAEKNREDWIRSHTTQRFVRWQWENISDMRTFRDFLAARGVHPRRAA